MEQSEKEVPAIKYEVIGTNCLVSIILGQDPFSKGIHLARNHCKAHLNLVCQLNLYLSLLRHDHEIGAHVVGRDVAHEEVMGLHHIEL